MAVLASDSFNRANNTTSLGSTDSYNGGVSYAWTTAATWGINSNQAYKNSGSASNYAVAWINIGVSDFKISLVLAVLGNNSRIAFRRTDDNNLFFLQANGTTNYQLIRRQAGANTVLATISVIPTAGDTLEVTCNGSSLTVKINGANETTVTSTFNQTATQVGIGTNDSPARLDDFQVSDLSAGGMSTVHEGESILSSASNLIAESNLIYNGESTFSAISDLIAEASVIQSAEVILSAVSNLIADGEKISQEVSVDLSSTSNLSAIGSVIVNGETVLSANSDLTAIGEIVSMDISVDLSSRASLTAEGAVIKSGEVSFSAVSQLEALASLIVSGEVELSATSQLTLLPEKDLVGVIRLKGKRELYVYLKGKRELEVHLKGGLNVTEYNQNFTMESGDSKILTFDIGEDLTGAVLTWELYRRGERTPFLTKSGNFTNNAVQVQLDTEDTSTLIGTYTFELISIYQDFKSTLTKGVVTLE